MDRINTLLLVLCLTFVCGTAQAESINESQARNIAQSFMASHRMPSSGLKLVQKGKQLNASPNAKAAYYVFNSERPQGGYVIIAGDDRAPSVLGYCDKGTIDTQDIPEAMQELLDSYAEQIEALSLGDKAAPLMSPGAAISPLVSSVWSQNNPYNILLPFRPDGKHAAAGCVATAMAQVMYYHKWPPRPTRSIPEYTSTSLHYYMPELPPVDFNWSEMQDTYMTSDTTSTAAIAAATLTLYCAQSVEMDFKESSSGATSTSIPIKIANYFDYKPSAHSIARENYSSQEWADILYSELAAGRPIIYSGSKKTGGHAFVCDGYDGEGMFHFNWGWNGQSNGYFLLNVLNPDLQGTGSASGTYGYILSQGAIIGLEPGSEGTNVFELTSTDVALISTTTTRYGTNYNFQAIVTGRFRNYTSEVMSVSYGWGLYQGETLKKVIYETYNNSLRPGYYVTLSEKTVSFGSGITSGTYRIKPIYSEYSANNWRPCVGAEKNYIEVVINGNNCSFTGHGAAAEHDYTINDITMEGKMHNGRPVSINVNITNNGESCNELLYMHSGSTFIAAGYVSIAKGETADIPFIFMPSTAGNYTLTWSWNEDGSSPIASRDITISQMPEASLSGTLNVLNITDSQNRIVTSDKFSVEFTVTNNGTETYDEDLSFKLFKHTTGNSGSAIQGLNQPIVLQPGETKTVHVDFDNVIDGWKYFANAYFYNAGTQTKITGTSFYTIVFPEVPEIQPGDVNGDGNISIGDISVLINYLLSGDETGVNTTAADVNCDGNISIGDVAAIINILLSKP